MKDSPINESLKARITLHEGKRNKLYKCTAGKLTIGIGHNIEDNGLSDEAINFIFEEDLQIAQKEARTLFSNFDELDLVRQGVLIEMIFQMGRPTVAKFLRFRDAILKEDFQRASIEMLDSKWAVDNSPLRAKRLAKIMASGRELDLLA